MKILTALTICVFLNTAALAQTSSTKAVAAKTVTTLNIYVTKDKNATPLPLNSFEDLHSVLQKQGKIANYNFTSIIMDKDSGIFWLFPKEWQQQQSPSGAMYNLGADSDIELSVSLIQTQKAKDLLLQEIGEGNTLQAKTPLKIDSKNIMLYQYLDNEDKTDFTDLYITDYAGLTIAFIAVYPVSQTQSVTRSVQDMIRSLAGIKISAKAPAELATKTAITNVQLSDPDLKDMVTIKFPIGNKFFTTMVPQDMDIVVRNNRIYFACPQDTRCDFSFYLAKLGGLTPQQYEAKLQGVVNLKFRRLSSRNEVIGRLKVNIVKNGFTGLNNYNYFFDNGEKFVLTLTTPAKQERKLLPAARKILENTRLVN